MMAELMRDHNYKTKSPQTYFALKSENEVYYQMASILSHASEKKGSLADRLLLKALVGDLSNVFIEK